MALAALCALGGDLSGLWVTAGATLVLGALCALEALERPAALEPLEPEL